MSIKLLTEHQLEFLSFKGGCRVLSKCHIVGNHMSRLICYLILYEVHAETDIISKTVGGLVRSCQ